jgi:hypothetical protein
MVLQWKVLIKTKIKIKIMSNYLDDLKNSLEIGTFNSEAANKINKISAAADKVKFDYNKIEINDSDVSELLTLGSFTGDKKAIILGNVDANPVDGKTALEKNIEAEKYLLKLEHETQMNKYKLRILNLEDIVINGANKLISDINTLLDVCNTSMLKLSENDLEMKEFLSKFVEKYETIHIPEIY